jgi:hypothetical protein
MGNKTSKTRRRSNRTTRKRTMRFKRRNVKSNRVRTRNRRRRIRPSRRRRTKQRGGGIGYGFTGSGNEGFGGSYGTVEAFDTCK